MGSDVVLDAAAARAGISAPIALELKYQHAGEVGRDRLPQIPHGLLARVGPGIRVGELLEVGIETQRESLRVRARGEVRWVTPLATGALAGVALAGLTSEDVERLDQLLGSPARLGTDPSPALTPAIPFAADPVLAVAMLEPNPVLRQILSGALAKLTGALGARWALKLEACTTPDGFLASMASRHRQLAVVDCDAVRGAEEPLIDAIRSHAGYEKLPIVLLSGSRSARLEDRFAVTLQKPLTVKSFLHTTSLLVRA
jgi:hypothetical protein